MRLFLNFFLKSSYFCFCFLHIHIFSSHVLIKVWVIKWFNECPHYFFTVFLCQQFSLRLVVSLWSFQADVGGHFCCGGVSPLFLRHGIWVSRCWIRANLISDSLINELIVLIWWHWGAAWAWLWFLLNKSLKFHGLLLIIWQFESTGGNLGTSIALAPEYK